MEASSWRFNFNKALLHFRKQIVFIQKRMTAKVMYKKARMRYLVNYWKKESEVYQNELYHLIKKSKEANNLYEALFNYDENLVKKLLRLYLERCVF